MLKNMRLTLKLLLLFLPTAIALVALLVYFSFRANEINTQSKKALYDEAYLNTVSIMQADKNLYQAQVSDKVLFYTKDSLRDAEKATMIDDFNKYTAEAHDLVIAAMDNLMQDDALYTQYKHPSEDINLSQLRESFEINYTAWIDSYDLKMQSGNMGLRFSSFDLVRKDISSMSELLLSYAEQRSNDILSETKASVMASVVIVAGVLLLITLLAVFIIFYLKSGFKYVTGINQRIAYGELSVKIDEKRYSKDEVGQMVRATGQILSRLNDYVSYIDEIALVLGQMAKGDMRVELKQDYVGEFEIIKVALDGISSSMNRTLTQINEAAAQVNNGATQVSDAAQALAAGSTEQATATEQLAATINDVSSQVGDNASNASKAKVLAEKASGEVAQGNGQMKDMITAMKDISSSSSQINKIIKVIDDIAFQTNILALNAAVEAARAGGAGKGFAVVADEVRNLAGKSAAAAKTTADLIETSISKVSEGMKLADSTARSLTEIVTSVNETSALIEMIDKASAQQAGALRQISDGITQISNVIQTNSATAEQIAATSEELSGQSSMLKEEVGKFILNGANHVTAMETVDFIEEDFADEMGPDSDDTGFSSSKYYN